MPAIPDDIDLTNVEIAKALSEAANLRAYDDGTGPTSLAEAIADAIAIGAGILGRDRQSPFSADRAPSSPDLFELARYNAAVLIATDFIGTEPQPVSSAAIAFGVRRKGVDAMDSFVGMERSVMLLAGTIPLAAVVDGGMATDEDLDVARSTVLTALEWSIAESAALAHGPVTAAAAA